MDPVSIILLVSIFVTLLYFYGNYRRQYWARKKVPSLKPTNFIMGSTADIFLKKISLYDYHAHMYDNLAPLKYGGYYNFFNPMLIIRDPDLIKNILAKDFHYFMNRSTDKLDENDPLSQHLFNLKGTKWKTLRTKLTPTFTSGKIKVMFNFMVECAEELLQVINLSIGKEDDVEVKEMMARFTTDVISSCVFGLQSNSQKDPNSIFRTMGKRAFQPSTSRRIVSIVSMFIPKFREIFRIPFFEKEISEFFKSLVTNTIKFREENDVQRNDFLDLLIALKKQEVLSHNLADGEVCKFEFTDNLLTAQCFVFFLAGFETSSGTLTFALYELAKHPKIQEVLFDEIKKTLDESNPTFSYDSLSQMPYLDQVICETLRMYPLLPALVRICSEKYRLDENVVLDKNTRILIPVKGLHFDPLYYENPNEFNPENFSKEAKAKRHHFAYLPFGEGPRICIDITLNCLNEFKRLKWAIISRTIFSDQVGQYILESISVLRENFTMINSFNKGMRFGLTQVKLGLATIIRHYSISLSPKMNGPLKYPMMAFLPTPKDGMWLKFEKRDV